jgi:hypothetical protein
VLKPGAITAPVPAALMSVSQSRREMGSVGCTIASDVNGRGSIERAGPFS